MDLPNDGRVEAETAHLHTRKKGEHTGVLTHMSGTGEYRVELKDTVQVVFCCTLSRCCEATPPNNHTSIQNKGAHLCHIKRTVTKYVMHDSGIQE